MRFSQSNDLPGRAFRSFTQSLSLTVIAAAIVLAAAPILGGCGTMNSARLQAKTSRMLTELGTIQSATKAIALIEIDKSRKSCTLYYRICYQSPLDEPIDSLSGVGDFKSIPLFTVGGEEATVEFGPYLPNGIERHYTAKFQHPIPPGGWVDLMIVLKRLRKNKGVDGGLWDFGPEYWKTYFGEVDCLLAVRLPKGRRLMDAEPEPDEIRYGRPVTVIWRKLCTLGEEIEISLEYR